METNFDTENSKITMKKSENQPFDHAHAPSLKIEIWFNQAENWYGDQFWRGQFKSDNEKKSETLDHTLAPPLAIKLKIGDSLLVTHFESPNAKSPFGDSLLSHHLESFSINEI